MQQLSVKEKVSVAVEEKKQAPKPKPSTWAALFKSNSTGQSPKPSNIISVQVEQDVKNEKLMSSAESVEASKVISVQNDVKAKALAGRGYLYRKNGDVLKLNFLSIPHKHKLRSRFLCRWALAYKDEGCGVKSCASHFHSHILSPLNLQIWLLLKFNPQPCLEIADWLQCLPLVRKVVALWQVQGLCYTTTISLNFSILYDILQSKHQIELKTVTMIIVSRRCNKIYLKLKLFP